MSNIRYNIHANPNSIPVIHSNWYPNVAVSEKNLRYAHILMPDFASAAIPVPVLDDQQRLSRHPAADPTDGRSGTASFLHTRPTHHPAWGPAGMPLFRT